MVQQQELIFQGVKYCAKTGTAQNPHGKNHAVFTAYAPKDNPTIAVAVVVENSGYGGTWAGPVAAYMIEKYLNDTLTTENAKKVEAFSKVDLIPAAIKNWYYRKDSLRVVREREKELIEKQEAEADSVTNVKTTFDPEAEPNKKGSGDNDSIPQKSPMLVPTEKKKKKDSTNP
jgi:penicillin-binding protein 2